MEIELSPPHTPGASVITTQHGWQLEIPPGPGQTYRLAQLDDYSKLKRSHFRHTPPRTLQLRARVSDINLPGTWGFGLWNDPFGFSIGFGGRKGQLPALPEAAWFMHASPPNWLALGDNPVTESGQSIPANGFFAGTYRAWRVPSLLFAPAAPLVPLLALRPVSRLLRKLASQIVRQEAVRIETDVRQWHEYSVHWQKDGCVFSLDGKEVLATPNSPRPPLGLVIWIDNQFAAWTPSGRLAYGALENPSAWLEIEGLSFLQK